MDYDALKEQWGEVEDRDGVRLSWNVFPSSRMVRFPCPNQLRWVDRGTGSFAIGCPHRGSLHSPQGEARHSPPPVRARHMQAALPVRPESVLVGLPVWILCF